MLWKPCPEEGFIPQRTVKCRRKLTRSKLAEIQKVPVTVQKVGKRREGKEGKGEPTLAELGITDAGRAGVLIWAERIEPCPMNRVV